MKIKSLIRLIALSSLVLFTALNVQASLSKGSRSRAEIGETWFVLGQNIHITGGSCYGRFEEDYNDQTRDDFWYGNDDVQADKIFDCTDSKGNSGNVTFYLALTAKTADGAKLINDYLDSHEVFRLSYQTFPFQKVQRIKQQLTLVMLNCDSTHCEEMGFANSPSLNFTNAIEMQNSLNSIDQNTSDQKPAEYFETLKNLFQFKDADSIQSALKLSTSTSIIVSQEFLTPDGNLYLYPKTLDYTRDCSYFDDTNGKCL